MTVQVTPATSGGWLAFVSGERMLALAPRPDEGFVAAAWSALVSSDGFQRILDLLASHGLASMPPFALVEWSDGNARVIVRGDAVLTVTDAAGSTPLTGTGVSTWLERSVPGVTAFALEVPGAVAASVAELPLDSGVALMSALGWSSIGEPSRLSSTPARRETTVVEQPSTPEPDPADTVREAPAEKPAAKAEPATTEEPAEGYDYLFGDTMYRSVADAAVHESEPEPAVDPTTELGGEHDGHTVLTSDLAKLRGPRKRQTSAPTPPAPPAPKLVLVVSTTGAREPLTQSILVGRAPSVSKVSGGQMPRLVTLGADQDISRNHAQISLEGGTVVVTDLHSKNGTAVVLPGKPAQKLRAGEPTSVIVGTVVDLGGGVTLTVDED
jgi:hypothetical protein